MQALVLGQTGSGKTTLLRNIITQDLMRRVGPPGERQKIPMVIFDGKGDLEFFHSLLPYIHRAGRMADLRLLNPSRPDLSVQYNPFASEDDNYMAQVSMVFGSFDLHDEFFAKHQLNYLADIVRILHYTGKRFNFYDVMVMALDQAVIEEQVRRRAAAHGAGSGDLHPAPVELRNVGQEPVPVLRRPRPRTQDPGLAQRVHDVPRRRAERDYRSL